MPALAFVLAFDYWPLLRTIYMSTQGTNIFGQATGFVGLKNYAVMFASADFQHTLWVTLVFTVASVAAKLVIGLAIALPLAQRLRGTGILRAAVLVPMAVSVAVAGLIFKAIYQPQLGAGDRVASFLGGAEVGWLTSPDMAMVSVVALDAWTGIGFTVLLLLAALDGVPEDVLEAASLDGAGPVRKACHITLPLISPTLFFIVVTQSISGLREFTAIQILTGGGPANATHTLVIDIYRTAFGGGTADYGASSARGVVLLLIILAISIVQFRVLEKKVNYS
ncbi:carbohydrate ABC transporter permease [Pseudarthrobacter sp. H2]|uniref:carbohydrate ABC transporter permease n=1 Tax=Pseudarthrobacter sp. H2 TaxID=3418415 RepID=UPI003CE80B3B